MTKTMFSGKSLEELLIAVILPAYNEELTIANVIRAFRRELPKAFVVVVNNNSSDRTHEFAQQTLDELGGVGIVIDELRQGKGNAVRRAFTDVDADIYVLCDADMTYPAECIHQMMLPIIENHADMVVGDRHSGGDYQKENKRQFHDFGNLLVKKLVNVLFQANLKDIMSGYRVFTHQFVKNYPILVEGFQIETEMTLHALDKRFRVVEIPVDYKDRPEGSVSKLNTLSDGAKVIFTITQILRYYRPLFFFSIVSLIFALTGLAAAVPVIQDWLVHGYIYHIPLTILAAGLEIVAIVTLGVGILLDSVTRQHKYSIEKDLMSGSRWKSR